MVKNKAPKKQQRGVDFKKIKRKIGRKLPPPKNTTDTQIKSKAIILPEQSVASEKAGLAVSRKGLTLKELLQQTSHHNPKVRLDALNGIKDILLKHPVELRSHKLAIVEKLRERISDNAKSIRESLYDLLKTVIFPGCEEDNQGPFISLMMAYIFNAMTNLEFEVRLMAFKFVDLVIQHYPSSLMFYAEKIFQNYEDLLRKNQFHLLEEGNLKNVLAGLVHCLSLLPREMSEHDSPRNKEVFGIRTLHAFEREESKNTTGSSVISEKLRDLMPVLVRCFKDIVPLFNSKPQLDAQSNDCLLLLLESIDLAVTYFGYGSQNSGKEIEPSALPYQKLGGTIQSEKLLKKLFDMFPLNPRYQLSGKDDFKYFVLNVKLTEIFLCSSEWHGSAASLEKFIEFIVNALSGEICSDMHSEKAVLEKNLISLMPFIPRLALHVSGYWRSRILQAFTEVFTSCSIDSLLKWVCLSAIEEMLLPDQGLLQLLSASDTEIFDYQITWIREFPSLLIKLGKKQPSRSKSVLSLLLRLGQCAVTNSLFAQEYDSMQHSLVAFYCTCMDEGNVSYGPFVQLERDAQELSICCLYYLSHMDARFLKSIVLCCLYDELEPLSVFRIIEVLDSAYKVGHIQMCDLMSFFITLLARFKVIPENSLNLEEDKASNRGIFKSLTRVVCSNLLQKGDNNLVLSIIEKTVINLMSLKPALDNLCALLRMLVALDSRHTRLSDQSITNMSKILPGYLIDVVSWLLENESKYPAPVVKSARDYYLLPCLFLFYRSNKLLSLVLNTIQLLVSERISSISAHKSDCFKSINASVSLILILNDDPKIHRQLSSCKEEIHSISQSILVAQSSEKNWAIDERHNIQSAVDRLRNVEAISIIHTYIGKHV